MKYLLILIVLVVFGKSHAQEYYSTFKADVTIDSTLFAGKDLKLLQKDNVSEIYILGSQRAFANAGFMYDDPYGGEYTVILQWKDKKEMSEVFHVFGRDPANVQAYTMHDVEGRTSTECKRSLNAVKYLTDKKIYLKITVTNEFGPCQAGTYLEFLWVISKTSER